VATPEPPIPSRTPRDELADTTAHGALYLQRLRQRQLTLSLLALVAFGALIGVLPLAIDIVPALRRIRLLSVPLAVWLVIVPAGPTFLALAILYRRRADTLDEDFRELVRRR
jgi:putative solute:sodium symporter small subunit